MRNARGVAGSVRQRRGRWVGRFWMRLAGCEGGGSLKQATLR